MKTNKKAKDYRVSNERLAGGYGSFSAIQNSEQLLRRAVMASLLWEDLFYQSGKNNAENIENLIASTDPEIVYNIAIEAREEQKLRHVPLYIARIMASLPKHKKYVGKLLPQIIKRADELTEFLAIYWKDEKQPLSKQVKIGLSDSFNNFNEYHFAKYKGSKNEIKLKDVVQLVHPKPANAERSLLYKRILDDNLKTPDTWEVALSTGENKKETWERLISENKLGALAFLRNLRNMRDADVSKQTIEYGFGTINSKWLLPLNYLSAVKYAPEWKHQIEKLMMSSFAQSEKLKGHTVFVVDVSGSMMQGISGRSEFNRLDVAKAMAVMANNICESVNIYATAGDDYKRIHKTALLEPVTGFEIMDEIESSYRKLGGGGIFTRQCLEYIKEKEKNKTPDRIIVFSDSQDCDYPDKRIPAPFGKYNYIIDVSAHSHGIGYDGVWTAEISGWSEKFLSFIMASEGIIINNQE